MNFDGYKPFEIALFSSLVEQDDCTALPLGVAAVARNVRFHGRSVRTRDGIQAQFGFHSPNAKAITGLASLNYTTTTEAQVPVAFDAQGTFMVESPVGAGGAATPVSGAGVTPPANASMQAAAAYNKGYLAFTDLLTSKGAPAVYNLKTGNLDAFSMRPVGEPWKALTTYRVGEVVTPSTVGGNGHTYRCTTGGISAAAQPAFPTTEGGTVADGTVTWTETTPVMAQFLDLVNTAVPTVVRNAGAGTFAAGRDVYIAITLVNGNGETVLSGIFIYNAGAGTVLNDRFTVSPPTLPTWVTQLTGANTPTAYKVYEADVAHGAAAPVVSAYKLVASTALANSTNVDTTGAGAAPPTSTTARIVPVGNICAGLRYGVVLFVNRNGYISGMADFSFFRYTAPGDGFQLYLAHVPLGPSPETAARVVAFTPAGQLSALAGTGITSEGPYFWIPPKLTNGVFDLTQVAAGVSVADVVQGISMNSTLINDNTTTTATFNFTDDYLKSTREEVSPFFRRIQITAADDIVFLPSLKRTALADPALPSGWRISGLDDPEGYDGEFGIVQVSENDGFKRTAIREFASVVYPMKENGGYTLSPDPNNPENWIAPQKWTGSGPCGPRAVDVCPQFMCYVHRSGVYIFTGATDPKLISIVLPITWSQINWQVQHTIWVMIDAETREIRIGIPYGQGVTAPNKVLKCNYEEAPDFGDPMHVTFEGNFVASVKSYKWSIDDIAANVCIRAQRPLVNPPADLDLPTTESQLLYGSSNPDGVVSAVIPMIFNDMGFDGQQFNKVGIDSVYEGTCPAKLLSMSKVGGLQANIDGDGDIFFTLLAGRAKAKADGGLNPAGTTLEIPLKKTFNKQTNKGRTGYACGARGPENERWRPRFTNNKAPDAWFDVKQVIIWAQLTTSAVAG